jgi:hypothetical protein
MTDSITVEELADRLYDLACADFQEHDPTTGEAFDADGRLIVEASIKLRELIAAARRGIEAETRKASCICWMDVASRVCPVHGTDRQEKEVCQHCGKPEAQHRWKTHNYKPSPSPQGDAGDDVVARHEAILDRALANPEIKAAVHKRVAPSPDIAGVKERAIEQWEYIKAFPEARSGIIHAGNDLAIALTAAQARCERLEKDKDGYAYNLDQFRKQAEQLQSRNRVLVEALRQMAHPTAYEDAHLELGRLRKIARAALQGEKQ